MSECGKYSLIHHGWGFFSYGGEGGICSEWDFGTRLIIVWNGDGGWSSPGAIGTMGRSWGALMGDLLQIHERELLLNKFAYF